VVSVAPPPDCDLGGAAILKGSKNLPAPLGPSQICDPFRIKTVSSRAFRWWRCAYHRLLSQNRSAVNPGDDRIPNERPTPPTNVQRFRTNDSGPTKVAQVRTDRRPTPQTRKPIREIGLQSIQILRIEFNLRLTQQRFEFFAKCLYAMVLFLIGNVFCH
jgi:hypothetical protein